MEQNIINGEKRVIAYLYEQSIIKQEVTYFAKMTNDLPFGATQLKSLITKLFARNLIIFKWAKKTNSTWVKAIKLTDEAIPLAKNEYTKLMTEIKEKEKEK